MLVDAHQDEADGEEDEDAGDEHAHGDGERELVGRAVLGLVKLTSDCDGIEVSSARAEQKGSGLLTNSSEVRVTVDTDDDTTRSRLGRVTSQPANDERSSREGASQTDVEEAVCPSVASATGLQLNQTLCRFMTHSEACCSASRP